MKKSRFSEEQMVRMVRESGVAGVPATAKKHAVEGNDDASNGAD